MRLDALRQRLIPLRGLGGLLSSAILGIVLAAVVASQLGTTMTSTVTSACLATALALLVCGALGLGESRLVPSVSILLMLSVSGTALLGDDWALVTLFSLCLGVLILILGLLAPVRRLLMRLPDSIRTGIVSSVGITFLFCALRICGVVSVSDSGALSIPGLFDPTFVDALISLLATSILASSGVPGAGLLGLAVAVAAGIPLGLTQAPAGLLTSFDLSLVLSTPEELCLRLPQLAAKACTPEFLGLLVTLALAVFLSTTSASHDGGSGYGVAKPARSLACRGVGCALASLFGLPGFMPAYDWGEGQESKPASSRHNRWGLSLCGLVVAILACLSPLVALVPVSAAFGPLALSCLRFLEPVLRCRGESLVDVVSVVAALLAAFVTGSPVLSASTCVVMWTALAIGSGSARSVSGGVWALFALSVLYLLAVSGV